MPTFKAPSLEEMQVIFPNHQIEEFIAQGGMGAVYLARQLSLDRPVAIKILPQEFGGNVDYRASFHTEAKVMAKLNHKNLVGIYDFGDMDGMLYIIMEYVPGRTLFESANGRAVEQVEAARLIADMCHGLDHAHNAGMLHRDIKPANVLIDDEARPKIVDFGLARPLDQEQTDGIIFGTPGYTAPEVLSNPFEVDHRSDIFSMGVMLYEMLTGHLPGKPVIPASKKSGSNMLFDQILHKAIHHNPEERFSTAAEMARALEDVIVKLKKIPSLITSTKSKSRPRTVAISALGGRVGRGFSVSVQKQILSSSKPKSNIGLLIIVIAALVMCVLILSSLAG